MLKNKKKRMISLLKSFTVNTILRDRFMDVPLGIYVSPYNYLNSYYNDALLYCVCLFLTIRTALELLHHCCPN